MISPKTGVVQKSIMNQCEKRVNVQKKSNLLLEIFLFWHDNRNYLQIGQIGYYLQRIYSNIQALLGLGWRIPFIG